MRAPGAGGERRAGDDRGFVALEQVFAENWREVERNGHDRGRTLTAARLDPANSRIAWCGVERLMQRVTGELEPARDGAQFVQDRGELLVEPCARLDALAHEPQPFPEQRDLAEGVVERAAQSILPDG